MEDQERLIINDHLYLRKVKETDLDDVYAIYRDEEVARYLLSEAWNEENKETGFKEKLRINEKEDCLFLGVILDEKLIGTLSAWKKQMKDTYEIGYVFNAAYQNQGYAALSLKRLIDYLFNEKKAHRLYGELDARNTASIKLLERCGFIKEAYFREDCFSKNEWTDTLVYAMLEKDYLKQ